MLQFISDPPRLIACDYLQFYREGSIFSVLSSDFGKAMRASLDRLPKTLSAHWEQHRQEWEVALREQETVPAETTIMAISVVGLQVSTTFQDQTFFSDQKSRGFHLHKSRLSAPHRLAKLILAAVWLISGTSISDFGLSSKNCTGWFIELIAVI